MAYLRLWLIGGLLLPSSILLSQSKSPHVIVIMTDDLDSGLFEHLLKQERLPRIQRDLVDRGVTFAKSYVTNPICCPSRATFLTGQYSHNHGALAVLGPRLFSMGLRYWFEDGTSEKKESNTLPVWLQRSGYRTAHVGKYLNGYGWDTDNTYVPPGYDDWRGLVDISTYKMWGYKLNQNGTVRTYGFDPEEYQTDVLAGHAVDVLSSHDPAKPLFMTVMPITPHIEHRIGGDAVMLLARPFFSGIRPAPRHESLIDGDPANDELEPMPNKPSFNPSRLSIPKSISRSRPMDAIDVADQRRQYRERAASMIAVDDLIGTLVDQLEKRQMLADTMILFTSDNGWFHGEHRLSHKSKPYEEGSRVPLIVRCPGCGEGIERNDLVGNIDVAPTIMQAARARSGLDMDGRAMRLASLPEIEWPRQRLLIENFSVRPFQTFLNTPSYGAIREQSSLGSFLYVEWYQGHVKDGDLSSLDATVVDREFYDLFEDPYQTRPRAVAKEGQSGLHRLIEDLRVCKGSDCRALENAHIPRLQSIDSPQQDRPGPLLKHNPLKFFVHVYLQKTWVFVWVCWLIGINMLSLAFLRHREARIIAGTFAITGTLMLGLFSLHGFDRLLGLPHIVTWGPMIVYLRRSLPWPPRGVYQTWLLTAVVTIIVSLGFDVVDVIRFVIGS